MESVVELVCSFHLDRSAGVVGGAGGLGDTWSRMIAVFAPSSLGRGFHFPPIDLKSQQHAISPYRKAVAESSLRGSASWKSVALPEIPESRQTSGPAGPAGPVEGPLSPDPLFQVKESKALTTWMQAAQNGDAEAQNNVGVSYYRGINGVQKVRP